MPDAGNHPLDTLDMILAAPAVDQAAAEEALNELQGACNACHTILWREYVAHPDR